MPNTGSLINQIGESFEQIGKDIARETVQAPKDIVGKALESLGSGTSSKKAARQKTVVNSTSQQAEKPKEDDSEIKQAVARAALSELAGGKKSQEPSEYEKRYRKKNKKTRKRAKEKNGKYDAQASVF